MGVAQAQFLNALLTTKDTSMLINNNLDVSFFSDYQNEFKFIKNHIDTYNKVPDKESFLSVFPNFDIIDVSEPREFLLESLYNDKNLLYMTKVFNSVRPMLMDGRGTDAIKMVYAPENIPTDRHIESIDLLTDKTRYDSYVDRCNSYQDYYVKTGFPELDELIGGWDRKEELVTIAARTNVGKTWAALKCAVAALEQGLRVGIYSGEMSDRKVGYRIDTLISHISNTSITRGNVVVQNDYKKYIDDLCNRYNGCLKVITPKMLGDFAGVSSLRAFIEKDNLDILIVDQHSLLEDERNGRSAQERAANISKDLRNLQALKQIPIIAVSQQNRSKNEDGTVDSTMIAQSDRIGQDSTIIIMFEKKDDIMTLNLVKARDSANFKKLDYKVDFDRGIWDFQPNLENDEGQTLASEQKSEEFNVEYGEDIF